VNNIIDIVEDHYEQLEPFLTMPERAVGRPRWDDLSVLKGILWVLVSGARWKDLPEQYPSYQTCHRRFQIWVKRGTFQRILQVLVKRTGVDLSETYIDGTFALARKGGKKVGISLRGKGSKVMLLLSKNQIPVSVQVESGAPHEVSCVPSLIQNRMVRSRPKIILGDKAYDSDRLDKELKKAGIEMIAPNRDCRLVKDQDRRKLRRMRRRWRIERYFSWLKNHRRLISRWETNPDNFLGMVLLACIGLTLKGF